MALELEVVDQAHLQARFGRFRFRVGAGALIITSTILGVPYYVPYSGY